MAIDLKALTVGRMRKAEPGEMDGFVVPPPTARAHNLQRLQVGTTGLLAILLLVGLASIIKDRVDETEATVMADTGESVEGAETPGDALVDAGVVPDLPAEPSPSSVTGGAPAEPAAQASDAETL